MAEDTKGAVERMAGALIDPMRTSAWANAEMFEEASAMLLRLLAQRDAADRAGRERIKHLEEELRTIRAGMREIIADDQKVVRTGAFSQAMRDGTFAAKARALLAPAAIDEGKPDGPDDRDRDYLRHGLREEDLP